MTVGVLLGWSLARANEKRRQRANISPPFRRIITGHDDRGHSIVTSHDDGILRHFFDGVKEPGWVGTVEVPSGTCTLFAPELPKSYAVWHVCGVFVTLELDAVAAMA